MNVFISWSGERSRAIAEVLRGWLPSVLQSVRPYFSPDDAGKGSRWQSEIAERLDESRVGLLVITPENVEAPWLNFEAGALGKHVGVSRVCPLLFGKMEPTDLEGPLVQFQAAKFSKDEMGKVIRMLNDELGDERLSSEVLARVFEKWWPDLDREVLEKLKLQEGGERAGRRSERDMLEELLVLTRSALHQRARTPDDPVLVNMVTDLVVLIATLPPGDQSLERAANRLRGHLFRLYPEHALRLLEKEQRRLLESREQPRQCETGGY